MTSIWTCEQDHCGRRATLYGGGCRRCSLHLCPDHHWDVEIHPCVTIDEEVKDEIFATTEDTHLNKLIDAIDVDAIEAQALAHRPGHTCKMLPKPYSLEDRYGPDMFMHGSNAMIPLTWDDGEKWWVRIRQLYPASPPTPVRKLGIISEAATMEALSQGGVRGPRVWVPSDIRTGPLEYIFIEHLDGKDEECLLDPDRAPTDRTRLVVENLAKWLISLENVHFDKVGSLTLDDDGNVSVDGVLNWVTFNGSEPWLLGPYATARERYYDHFDQTMKRIVTGHWVPQLLKVQHYLVALESRTLVELCPGLDEGPWYLKHADSKGDVWLVNEQGEITGGIDWELAVPTRFPLMLGAVLTAKAEAFAAPPGLAPLDFRTGDNRLSLIEEMLADSYVELGRPDLAEFVRNGKKYQRLDQLTKIWLQPWEALNAARRAVLGMDEDEAPGQPQGWDEWIDAAKERYSDDAGLKALLGAERASRLQK